MKISKDLQNKVSKFQEGGAMPTTEGAPMEQPMPAEAGAPAAGAEQDPLMQIAQVAAQALQTQDCQAAMAVCQAFVEMVASAQGGGQPQQEMPAEPIMQKKGGKLGVVRRIKR